MFSIQGLFIESKKNENDKNKYASTLLTGHWTFCQGQLDTGADPTTEVWLRIYVVGSR